MLIGQRLVANYGDYRSWKIEDILFDVNALTHTFLNDESKPITL